MEILQQEENYGPQKKNRYHSNALVEVQKGEVQKFQRPQFVNNINKVWQIREISESIEWHDNTLQQRFGSHQTEMVKNPEKIMPNNARLL